MPFSLRSDNEEDDEPSIPLLSQWYLSNPVHHKPVTFVPAVPTLNASAPYLAPSGITSAADRYYSVVFGSAESNTTTAPPAPQDGQDAVSERKPSLCPTCHLPLSLIPSTTTLAPHECLLAHQLSLPHSHPPSHLPRSNRGLQYLSSYGWDPESRQGLGTNGEGIRVPIKLKVKVDTSGLGLKINKERKAEPKKVTLDAGKMRKLERDDKKKREKLQREFWGRDDVEKYLGPG